MATKDRERETAIPGDGGATVAEMLGGLRMTKQRRVVYEVVSDLAKAHPTAAEVYSVAKRRMPSISLATVYNCLETLTQAGAVTQVNIDREASRFCPNLQPHAHFFCSQCSSVFDIDLRPGAEPSSPWDFPTGFRVEEVDVALRGVCPSCRERRGAPSREGGIRSGSAPV